MLGATVYTFSIVLAVFLIGLGIGSSVASFVARSALNARTALVWCQALLVLATAWAALMLTHSIPYWPVNPSLSLSPWYTFQLDFVRCLWVVLPAAILWGASFPLAVAAAAPGKSDPGRLVGGLYAANTVGAIVGALVFSLGIVPSLGTQWAQRVLVILPALAVGSLLGPGLFDRNGRDKTDLAGALVTVIGLAMFLSATVSAVPWGIAAYGRYMATYAYRCAPGIIPESKVPQGGSGPDAFCTYFGEGLNGTVAVTKLRSGVRNFHSAGKVQASTDPHDMRLQRLLGHISALAHPRPESALVVACGAGVTAGSFVSHPYIKQIVICDIEPLVPRNVTPMFERENNAVLKDPRTHVVFDDGRHFIRTTGQKFDIITSDPIDPWVKGCAALNTEEYYGMCKEHLNPGGVMSLWIPLYESNEETIKSVLATFFKVFPNGIVWTNDSEGEGYDAVLFGQREPTRINIDDWQDRINRADHAEVKKSLAQVEFYTATDLLATYAGQAIDLKDWLRDAQINTDRNLRLQYLAGMWLNSYMGSALRQEIHVYYRFPENLFYGSKKRKDLLKFSIEGNKGE